MLTKLSILNYALIRELEIDLSEGLSVITGETGAGKSIIMGALGLVLGQRSDAKAIFKGEKKCVIEAYFNIEGYNLEPLFEEIDVDFEINTIVRREVQDTGKSRAFINDTPVTLQQLKEVVMRLIDIHSQHDTQLLNSSQFQMMLVDAVANSGSVKEEYGVHFKKYKELVESLAEVEQTAKEWSAEKEYAQFQFEQLETAALKEAEQSELEEELNKLTHVEDIQIELSKVTEIADNGDFGLIAQLKQIEQSLSKVSKYVPIFEDTKERLASAYIELKDIISEVESYAQTLEMSPDRKAFVEQRLDLIYTLQQKHKVQSVGELLEMKTQYGQKLQRIDSFDEELENIKKEIDKERSKLEKLAKELTKKRTAVASEISKNSISILKELGIVNANFELSISKLKDFSSNGLDQILFLFAANKNATLQPMATIASGGEMSRVMLAIKALASAKMKLPTIIFDEIDTGVSGDIAYRMGDVMKRMSADMQVITITHLPQIASQGRSHFKVYKADNAENTQTQIMLLNKDQRIIEIAEMLSTKNPSQAAIDNAKELLLNNN